MADREEIKRNLQKLREEHETPTAGTESVSHDADLRGDGAVAQGQDSLAVGADGIGLKGDVGGSVIIVQGGGTLNVGGEEALRLFYPTTPPNQAAAQGTGRKRIFISYKRGTQPDETLALALHESLNAEHDVFIDQIMPVGTDWRGRIQQELESCDFLIPLLSASSAHSEMVEYEVSSAHQLGRARESGLPRILPVRVAYTAPFDYPLRAYLNPLNWAFWRSEADTPALAAELRTAISGGELRLADLREKQSLLQPEHGLFLAPDRLGRHRPDRTARRHHSGRIAFLHRAARRRHLPARDRARRGDPRHQSPAPDGKIVDAGARWRAGPQTGPRSDFP